MTQNFTHVMCKAEIGDTSRCDGPNSIPGI